MTDAGPTASDFDDGYAAVLRSSAIRQVLRVGFPDLPPWMETYGLVPFAAMERVADLLGDRKPGRLLDLACGLGGPGIHIADRLGADVVGVDWSRRAVTRAASTAADRRPGRTAYATASADRLPFVAGAFDAAMCIDALSFFPGLGIAEITRVLRPGARLVFTIWERDRPIADLPAVPSFATTFEDAGYSVIVAEEHPEWLEMQEMAYREALRRHVEDPLDEAVGDLAREAQAVLDAGDTPRRVLVVVERP